MEFRIEPTSDMVIKLKDKTIGKLEGLVLDTTNTSLLGFPKIKLSLSIDAKSFDDSKTLSTVIDKVSKFKFLDIVVRK